MQECGAYMSIHFMLNMDIKVYKGERYVSVVKYFTARCGNQTYPLKWPTTARI